MPLALAVGLLWAAVPAAAETLIYEWDMPEGDAVSYSIDLEVRKPGLLVVEAEWAADRQISFRLIPPDGIKSAKRRVGMSPLRLEVHIEPDQIRPDPWTLSIRTLPSRESGPATVKIHLPEGIVAEEPPPIERLVPIAPVKPPEPWMLPAATPREASPEVAEVFDTTESFRRRVIGEDERLGGDACRWQGGMLRFLAEQRDRVAQGGGPPAFETREVLARIAETIREVDGLRTTSDPVLAGPAPRDPQLRQAWLRLRERELEPLESQLDSLLNVVQREHAPELDGQDWPARLITCLMACERHFEQQLVVGSEKSVNRDLATMQWSPILAAGEALEALTGLRGEERIRLSSR